MTKLDKSKRFLIVGRAGIDFYPDPPGTKTEDAVNFFASLGGSAGNIAVALSRQGLQASLMTCVSDDAVGRYTLNQLRNYGVESAYVRSVGGEFRNTLAVVESRIEDFQSVIYRNNAADFQMSLEDAKNVDYSDFATLVSAGTVLAAEPSRTAAFHSMDLAKQAGLSVVFDIDYRPYTWASAEEAADVLSLAGEKSDVIVGNDEEFDFMAGGVGKGEAFARDLAKEKTFIIYKKGPEGSVTFADGREFETPIYPVQALKPIGAGDSFMGGLLAALALGDPLELAVKKGSAAAAIVVSKVGCAPAMPTPDELKEFMDAYPTV